MRHITGWSALKVKIGRAKKTLNIKEIMTEVLLIATKENGTQGNSEGTKYVVFMTCHQNLG